ncbi:MAG: hypothetical protein WAL63_01375 [Solirubrobacteraceae bacterium]
MGSTIEHTGAMTSHLDIRSGGDAAELTQLRRRRRADLATIEALTQSLAVLQRGTRALKEENEELRRQLGRRQRAARRYQLD